MEMNDFIKKVAEMRKLQKDYFRTRDSYVLKKAKEAEAAIDAEIKLINDKQTKLELWQTNS